MMQVEATEKATRMNMISRHKRKVGEAWRAVNSGGGLWRVVFTRDGKEAQP